LEIVGNEFLRCGANGVFLVGDEATKTGSSPVLVADNVILDGGWQKGGTSGISSLFTGPGNLILRNFVAGQTNGTVGEEGADWYGDGNGILADLDSAGTLIIGNVTVANQGAGISVNRSSDSIVLHNTAVDNGEAPHLQGNAGIYVSGETGPSDRQLIANNLLYGNKRGQVWVWRTALDHEVNHNLLAPGPLTSPGPHPFVYEVDWYGTIYTFDEWTESPPRAGIGMGSQGSRPVFLGDLLGGDPGREPLYYLPVAGGPGDAAAAPRGDFAAIPAIVAAVDTFPSAGPLLEALGDGFGRVPRPAEDANIGALEWPEGDFLYEGIGPYRHETGPGEEHRLWAGPLGTWLRMTGGGLESTEFGTIDPSDTPQVFASARFGWVHHGKNPDQYAGWIWSERFAWMKFEQAGDETYLWVPMMNSWMSVNADGSFTSFQWGRLVPEGLNRYDSSVFGGLTTGDFGGWVASDRFGWMWANGDGVWFWSQDRQEWLGVTEGGGIWSTAEGRFL
jgi:parallel beta-helix repeat protein